MTTKYIFVTGGVVSSLGKGLTSASIGMLLEHRGLRVRMQKLDPYINVDPGTMSPFQHGEVYVLDDGSETDLDLGHYERFTESPLTRDSNYTTGQIYQAVINKERRGEFLGKTVQVIPHITDEIKSVIRKLGEDDVDVVITEIGGTVGDIESQPFLEAIRQFSLDVGKENCLYIHLTLVPYLKAAGELKTKPTQHSVGQLREIGIQPHILICRTERSLSRGDREKIALFCNVPLEAVIEEKDKDFSIYEVPFSLVDNGLDELIVDQLGLDAGTLVLDDWHELMRRLRNPQHEISIAVVGKYAAHCDAYKSIYEALDHAGIANEAQVRIQPIQSEDIEREGPQRLLSGYDGVLVPGGFGERGIEGKVQAIEYARSKGIPFLGICLGMQCAVIEFARHVVGLAGAHSSEFDKDTPHPVICLLDEQKSITDKGGTMRLGAQPCRLAIDSKAYEGYGAEDISERHRHRYEFNNVYRTQFEAHGMKFVGTSPDGMLVEIVELAEHPWFVAVQFHPEFKSKPTLAQPLFAGFIEAAVQRRSTAADVAVPSDE
ncbi:MAG: CTP synthase [Planctomycetota bacterium]|nr:MAG: CTP synthase [Planctomycetota bacterium]REJ90361.1 MAG: CTP synthase [Planctomycetota bacterium]REJ95624.1 MAG: CTP synthase [Planctomycetota bacterium]REK25191.1 MAG: CTP synthase [Planctomycetota bacterium]REK41004.1 MAG: CTP synthase [Planctomycetota bacterium]